MSSVEKEDTKLSGAKEEDSKLSGAEDGENKLSGSEDEESKLPVFTMEEVAKHNTAESLWLVVHDKVYDVTSFMEEVS